MNFKRNRKNCSNDLYRWLITSVLVLSVCLPGICRAQTPATGDPLELYRQLLKPVFNVADVHHIRHVAIDREDLHVVLTDGVIGLTQATDGHVLGAFFEGEGEILLIPPDRAERSSLVLFTHSAVLDTRFETAYLRFFDDKLVEQLRAGFRPQENPGEYLQKWNEVGASLARMDSLQLLQAMTNAADSSSRYLHLRLAGTAEGIFDIFFNANVREQISVSQPTVASGASFYDVWTSFPMRSAREPGQAASTQNVGFQVSDFRIHSKVTPPSDIDGAAEITLSARRPGQRTIVLLLSRHLKVREARLDGTPVPFIQNEAMLGSELARQGNDMVAIVLPAALQQDHPVKLTLKYSGPVMFDAGGDLLYMAARGTWYPNPGPTFANFELTFEYPSDWTLVGTGKRVSSSTQNGITTTRFVSDKPIAHAGFNLGKFETATVNQGNLLIEAYAARRVEQSLAQAEAKAQLHPDPARDVANIAHRAAATVEFLSNQLGPFPYSNLRISQLPALLSQSWPGLIYLSSIAFLTQQDRTALGVRDPYTELLMSELMLAHETAHQWWGDAVEWESYRDEWIIEAVANYCGTVMLERENPAKTKVVLDHYRTQLLRQTVNGIVADAGPVTLGPRLTSSKFPDAYEIVLYGRGTWLCHMLRTMLRQASVGTDDSLFFKALKSALAKSPNGKISTRDLQQAFEEVLPPSLFYDGEKSLDWFFDSWVNGTSIPQFSLENLQLTPAQNKVKVKGVIRQENAAKDTITAVPLYSADKEGHLRFLAFVFADDPKTEFELIAPAGTTNLRLDPENTILRR